jgi:P-type Ca2+ transporter type 2C
VARLPLVYAGTLVIYGKGRGVVVATGMSTEFGEIAGMLLGVQHARTPLQEDLDRLGRTLVWAGLGVVLMVTGLAVLRGQPLLEMLLFGIALAVAIVPEALPAVLTISLAIGARRMVQRHVLMRRLSAVEAIGCVSVICADKTGTLTKDEMTVRRILTAGEMLSVTGTGYEPHGAFLRQESPVQPPEPLQALLRSAVLASDALLVGVKDGVGWLIRGDPTEGALVVVAAKAGIHREALEEKFPRLGEIPFTSESRRMTTLCAGPRGHEAFSKGAPEVIVQGCGAWLGPLGEETLGAETRRKILQTAHDLSAEGLRVLAVAGKSSATLENAEEDMTFLGLLGMMDPPRPEAFAAVRACREAGIKVVMISGDHPLTARAVARELAVLGDGRVVTGAELEAMSEKELRSRVEGIEVYARMLPAQKLRIVTALQERGHVVAMTGDGVNDAPALRKAEVGVAMGITGTDVTREAADITVTDDNFASIVAAVEEGRCIFANTRKYLSYLFSSNIGEVGLMAGAGLVGLPMPLTAVQILYVNLATDGLPALALAADPSDRDLMRRAPRNPRGGIFTRRLLALMLLGGVWSALSNLGLYSWALGAGRPLTEARSLAFVTLVLMEFIKAFCFRSHRRSILDHPLANRWLNLAILWEILLLGAVIYVPLFHRAFGGARLTLQDWGVALLFAATIVPVLEIGKWLGRWQPALR